MSGRVLRIATRASQLALWQANFVAGLTASGRSGSGRRVGSRHHDGRSDSRRIAERVSVGSASSPARSSTALLDDRADLAVHSLKDLPTDPVDGISLAAVPERASPWDALDPACRIRPSRAAGSKICSPRARGSAREASAAVRSSRSCGPIFSFVDVRGNVDTRLRKLDAGEADALILAEAGLDRLGAVRRGSRLGWLRRSFSRP